MPIKHLGYDGYDMRLDYDGRTDGQPVYHGYAPPGTATSDSKWIIYRYTFSGNDVTVRETVEKGVWDDRATLFS